MTKTHCQICGRQIKVVRGWCGQTLRAENLIAHHGYQRPYQEGWQTASCYGARWRPYEVAADALPPCIEFADRSATANEDGLAKLLADPPGMLIYQSTRYKRPHGEPVVLARPENYDVNGEGSYIPGSYDGVFKNRKWELRRNAKMFREEAAALRKRLAAWIAPAGQKEEERA
jgi:hypothetical protein